VTSLVDGSAAAWRACLAYIRIGRREHIHALRWLHNTTTCAATRAARSTAEGQANAEQTAGATLLGRRRRGKKEGRRHPPSSSSHLLRLLHVHSHQRFSMSRLPRALLVAPRAGAWRRKDSYAFATFRHSRARHARKDSAATRGTAYQQAAPTRAAAPYGRVCAFLAVVGARSTGGMSLSCRALFQRRTMTHGVGGSGAVVWATRVGGAWAGGAKRGAWRL